MSHSFVGVAQLDRAFGYGPKGRGFESSRPRLIRVPEGALIFCTGDRLQSRNVPFGISGDFDRVTGMLYNRTG